MKISESIFFEVRSKSIMQAVMGVEPRSSDVTKHMVYGRGSI